MSANVTGFRWSNRTEEAALLVAKDEQTDTVIAGQCGVTQRQLERWKQHPEFAARVQEHRDLWRQEIKAKGIADRQNRIDSLNDIHDRMLRVIEERAADPSHADEPGWQTGLIVRTERHMGKVTVIEYAVDTALLKELREHKKQAAQDLGQWTEKQEHSGELLVRQYVGVPIEDV